MSQQLPVPVRNQSRNTALAVPSTSGSVSSSIARLAISLAPDILRATEKVLLDRSRQEVPPRQQEVQQRFHTHAVQLSEVEISTSLPFVRQVTVRNATSWTSLPVIEPEPVEPAKRSRGRLLGISGAVALVAAVMVRKAIPSGKVIDVPGRQRGW